MSIKTLKLLYFSHFLPFYEYWCPVLIFPVAPTCSRKRTEWEEQGLVSLPPSATRMNLDKSTNHFNSAFSSVKGQACLFSRPPMRFIGTVVEVLLKLKFHINIASCVILYHSLYYYFLPLIINNCLLASAFPPKLQAITSI